MKFKQSDMGAEIELPDTIGTARMKAICKALEYDGAQRAAFQDGGNPMRGFIFGGKY